MLSIPLALPFFSFFLSLITSSSEIGLLKGRLSSGLVFDCCVCWMALRLISVSLRFLKWLIKDSVVMLPVLFSLPSALLMIAQYSLGLLLLRLRRLLCRSLW